MTRSFTSKLTLGLVVLLVSGLCACDEAHVPIEPSCDSPVLPEEAPEAVTGSLLITTFTSPLDGGQLILTGTAMHQNGLAIREVFVGGERANNDSYNFSRWSVNISYEQLLTLELVSETATERVVRIDAVAHDACGQAVTFASGEVTLDLTPGVQLEALSINVAFPPAGDFLPVYKEPADYAAVPAVVTITADGPEAAGAQVALSASSGRLVSSAGEAGADSLVLASDGQSAASASFLYYGTEEGPATLTVSSQGLSQAYAIEVVANPKIFPSTGLIPAGGSLVLSVLASPGQEIFCHANPVEGIKAWTPIPGGTDLMVVPGAGDDNGDQVYDIWIQVDPGLAEDTTLILTCSDVFGQRTIVSYVGEAAIIPPEEDPGDGAEDGEGLPDEDPGFGG